MNNLRLRCSAAILAPALLFALSIPASAPALAKKLPPSSSQIAVLQLLDASLAAGKLRASSQRVARLYLESGAEMRPHRTQIALAAELTNVESSLVTLKNVILKDDKERRDLKRALESLGGQWAELNPVLRSKYSAAKTQTVYDVSEQMYIYSSKITFLFETASNSEAGYMIDVAGRLQSNSERIAKAAIHGITSRNMSSAVDFITWKKEYLEGYRELVGSPLNDDYQRRNLDLGKTMWGFFDEIISRATNRSDVSQILDISKCADGMWSITQSSRTTYVAAFRTHSGTDKLIARNSSKSL